MAQDGEKPITLIRQDGLITLCDNGGSPWTREKTLADAWLLRVLGWWLMLPLTVLELGPIYRLLARIPVLLRVLALRLVIRAVAWLHRCFGLRTGQHASLSWEMHALSTMSGLGRILPLNLQRMRFALSFGMESCCLPVQGARIEPCDFGYFVHCGDGQGAEIKAEARPVLLWIFGGAVVGGDAKANVGLASQVAARVGCDAFVANMRQGPEHTIPEIQHDAMGAYRYLIEERRILPHKVIIMGFSSGGGMALSMVQACAADVQQYGRPAGCVLLSPWVDYGRESMDARAGSTVRDIITTQRVYDAVRPNVAAICGGEAQRSAISPLYHSMAGLPPVYLSVSNHEVAAEEGHLLCAALRNAGVPVEFEPKDYVPHVFPVLCEIGVPEAVEAMAKVELWMQGVLHTK